MKEFVMRPEFVGLYPTTDTPTQYVDKLYLHANVAPVTVQDRLDTISEFGGAPTAADEGARARALLRVTQNPAFQTRELPWLRADAIVRLPGAGTPTVRRTIALPDTTSGWPS